MAPHGRYSRGVKTRRPICALTDSFIDRSAVVLSRSPSRAGLPKAHRIHCIQGLSAECATGWDVELYDLVRRRSARVASLSPGEYQGDPNARHDGCGKPAHE